MYKVSLVNMPFSQLSQPSMALTQLKSVVEERLGDRVRVRILYLSHDFGHFLGTEATEQLNNQSSNSGLGDWFFRRVAFPELQDNARDYFQRYFPGRDTQFAALKGRLLAKRNSLDRFMKQLLAQYSLDQEDLLGFTTMFSQTTASLAMAKLVKGRNSDVVTVMGGANCEGSMGRAYAENCNDLDYVFSGPSLVNFPDLVEHLVDGQQEKCQKLAGVYTQQNFESAHLEGHGAYGPERPMSQIVDLDYDSFLNDIDRRFPNRQFEPNISFETSRGCWWGERSHCTFCGLNGNTMAFREMPPKDAVVYLQGLIDRYGDRAKDFNCVDNILPRSYINDVFPALEIPEDVSFFYEVKADLKEHEMETVAAARVTRIQPGIEALNTSTLKLMKKGTTTFHNLVFLKHCITYNVAPAWNLLIGFPGEEAEVYQGYLELLPLLPHLPPPVGAFPVRFDRFSPYFYRAKEYGLDLSPYDFYRYIYPFEESVLAELAYYFEDRNYESRYQVDMVTWQQKLNTAVQAWHTLWRRDDGGEQPRLLFQKTNDRFVVYDSRSGRPKIHQLGDLDLELLDRTRVTGRKVRSLASSTKLSIDEVTDAIGRLTGLGLIYEENDKFMSLVVDGDRRELYRSQIAPPKAEHQPSSLRVVA